MYGAQTHNAPNAEHGTKHTHTYSHEAKREKKTRPDRRKSSIYHKECLAYFSSCSVSARSSHFLSFRHDSQPCVRLLFLISATHHSYFMVFKNTDPTLMIMNVKTNRQQFSFCYHRFLPAKPSMRRGQTPKQRCFVLCVCALFVCLFYDFYRKSLGI